MEYFIQQIADILKAKSSIKTNDSIKYLVTDSRRITFPESSLFIALVTARRDAHTFIPELYDRGIKNFMVNTSFDTTAFPGANFIFTDDTLNALQQLTAYHRQQFHYPVIGITGSNGKTVVKEWLYQLLSPVHNIVRSPRSYNSQVGVPLSVWQMNETDDLAVFEAGISMPGEMVRLQKMIQPTIGILTNIGAAHSENFSGDDEKLHEKLKLFSNTDVLICHAGDALTDAALKNFSGKLFRWSYQPGADIYVNDIIHNNGSVCFSINTAKEKFTVSIPFTDSASLWNACTCIAVMLYLNTDAAVIAERMQHLAPVHMRMQLQPGINGCSVINDSYNFDTASLAVAIDFLISQKQFENKTVIISDVPAAKNKSTYEAIISMLCAQKISKLITIGREWIQYHSLLKNTIPAVHQFEDTVSFIAGNPSAHLKNEVILLKGARIFEFEKIAFQLQRKVHQTMMEINLTAMVHNLNVYRSHLKPGVKLMGMVKAAGYGSGSAEVAALLQFHKADYLAVAYTDEGVELRKAGITLPIMVMNIDEDAFETLVDNNLEPELFSPAIFRSFISFLNTQGLNNYPVHIKLDTGMHRLGFAENDMNELLSMLPHNRQVMIKSVFSHLAGSDDEKDDDFTKQQAALFMHWCSAIEKVTGHSFIRHISNSAAIIRLPELQFGMVRLGIGLYGIDSSGKYQHLLHNVLTLKTTVAQLRTLKAGETVGYNRRGKIEKDSVIATLRIGYADGFRRSLSNGVGKVYINGILAPVMGTVAMDMIMVDVTGIENIHEDDEVEIFGNHLPVQQFAAWCGTIPYEIFTSIGQRVKRVYVEES